MISSLLLRVGAALLVVGLCAGIAMGVMHDFTLAVAHAHLNLVGFVLPFAAGLYYRAVPAAAEGALAKTQAWLAIIGGVTFPLGLVTGVGERYEPVAVVGSLVVLAAWLLFALIVFRSCETRPA